MLPAAQHLRWSSDKIAHVMFIHLVFYLFFTCVLTHVMNGCIMSLKAKKNTAENLLCVIKSCVWQSKISASFMSER